MTTATTSPVELDRPEFEPGRAYWPEMGEEAPKCLFDTQYTYRAYAIYWRVQHDSLAREAFKAHRVHPKDIEVRKVSEHIAAKRMGCDVFKASITTAAHRKLSDAGLCAMYTLLD